MGNWTLESIAWGRFDASKVDPEILRNIKAAALVERNGGDYRIYLDRVFADDPASLRTSTPGRAKRSSTAWRSAAGRSLPIRSWDFEAAFARFRAGYKLPLDARRRCAAARPAR